MAAIRTERRLDADDENQFIGNESVRRESSMSIHSRLAPDRLVSQHLVLVLGRRDASAATPPLSLRNSELSLKPES